MDSELILVVLSLVLAIACSPFSFLGTLACWGLSYLGLDFLLRKLTLGNMSKYVLVTGCDTGFGNLLAKRLDGLGYNVFAACLTEGGKTALDRETSPKVTPFLMDVTKPHSIQDGYTYIKNELPNGAGIWGIVNNAGIIGPVGPAAWLQRDAYQACFNVNVYGLIDVTRVFLPLVKKVKGRIVNTASVLGRFSIPFCAPYTLSKHCVESFCDSLRREIRPYGVRVITVEPGFFSTGLTAVSGLRRNANNMWESISEELKDEYGREFLDTMMENYEQQQQKYNKETHLVVDAYTHALTARFPKIRYHVGGDCKFFFIPLTYLPDSVFDWVLKMLNKKPNYPAVLKK